MHLREEHGNSEAQGGGIVKVQRSVCLERRLKRCLKRRKTRRLGLFSVDLNLGTLDSMEGSDRTFSGG